MCPKPSRGSALIYALCIMAIVAILSTVCAWRTRVTLHKALYLSAIERQLQKAQNITDRLIIAYANQINADNTQSMAALNRGLCSAKSNDKASCQFRDLQGLFNLNNVQKDEWRGYFSRLIQHSTTLSIEQANQLTQRLQRWISPAKSQLLSTSTLAKADNIQPPYHELFTPSEMGNIKGFNSDIIAKLSPYITALPQPLLINLNAAPAAVLQAINPSMTEGQALAFIQFREKLGVISQMGQINLKKFQFSGNAAHYFTLNSQYLAIDVTVNMTNQALKLTTFINIQHRPRSGSHIKIISQQTELLAK